MNLNELNSAHREELHIIYYDFPLLMSALQFSHPTLRVPPMGAKLMIYNVRPRCSLGLVDNMEDCSLQWSVWYGHSFQHLNSSQGIFFGGLVDSCI